MTYLKYIRFNNSNRRRRRRRRRRQSNLIMSANNDWDGEASLALKVMRESFASGKTRSIEWRRKQLLAMKKMMVKERRVLEQFLWKDLHKSAFEAYIYELVQTGAADVHCSSSTMDCQLQWLRPAEA